MMDPQVSRDKRDPINEARAAVEISTGRAEDVFNENGERIGERPVRGIDGTFWSQEVADGNLDSTQTIDYDAPLETLAQGMGKALDRDNVTANHVEAIKYMYLMAALTKDTQNHANHQFTVTAMQDGTNARLAAVAKYNNQRAAIANANRELTDTVDLGLRLAAPASPGALGDAIAVAAQKLGLTPTQIASAVRNNPELAEKLETLAGSPGFVDGTLTADQLKNAQKVLRELFEATIEFNDKITAARSTGGDDGAAQNAAVDAAVDAALAKANAEAEGVIRGTP